MIELYVYKGFDLVTRKTKDGFSASSSNIVVSLNDQGVDYDKITSIEQIYNIAEKYCFDFLQFKYLIKYQAETKGWANLTDSEKDICIELDILDNGTEKVVYLIGKGRSQLQAVTALQDAFAYAHAKTIKATRNRAEYKNAYKIVAKYLSIVDAADFFRLIETLYNEYINQAILGTQDGQSGLGLLDFYESTPGTIYEFAGLVQQNFTMQNGDPDASNLALELSNWFRYAV